MKQKFHNLKQRYLFKLSMHNIKNIFNSLIEAKDKIENENAKRLLKKSR